MYHGIWHPLFITKWAYINKKGLIIDGRNKEEIEIETIKIGHCPKLVIETQKSEGIKFNELTFPFTIRKLKADQKKIELTDSNGKVFQYHSGSKKMCSEKISYWDELHPMSEHDVFMRMIYGIDIEYFY